MNQKVGDDFFIDFCFSLIDYIFCEKSMNIYFTYGEPSSQISWMDKLNKPAEWTSWIDQLNSPAGRTSSFYLKFWPICIFKDFPFSLYIVVASEPDKGLVLNSPL